MIDNQNVPWDDYDALVQTELDVPDDVTLRAVAFVDKGGTSKTTSLAHMGVVAHNELGLDTLLVSLDGKQNDLATHFGLEDDLEEAMKYPTIAQTFAPNLDEIDEFVRDQGDNEDGILESLVVPTGEGPDLIPASDELDGVDSSLSNIDDTDDRYSILDEFLTEYVDEHYDLILIDVPGSTSNVATNALWATKHVFTPVRPSPLDTKQAEKIRAEIKEKIKKHEMLSDLELTMVMLSQVDRRTNAGQHFLSRFQEEFPVELAPETVRSTQDMINAQLERKTLFSFESDSSTAEEAREQYRKNTAELVRRLTTPDWKESEQAGDDVETSEVEA